MAMEQMITVDGVVIKAPASLNWGLYDVSAPDAGNDIEGTMFKARIGQKRKLELTWKGLKKAQITPILQAFNPEYVDITYFDPLDGALTTRNFYTGDRSADVAFWVENREIYGTLSLNVIQRYTEAVT